MKFQKGNKLAGNRRGKPNRSTATVKAVMEQAFHQLGGIDALVTWAKAEPTEFYRLFAKLLPVQIQGELQVNSSIAERLARAKERATGTQIQGE